MPIENSHHNIGWDLIGCFATKFSPDKFSYHVCGNSMTCFSRIFTSFAYILSPFRMRWFSRVNTFSSRWLNKVKHRYLDYTDGYEHRFNPMSVQIIHRILIPISVVGVTWMISFIWMHTVWVTVLICIALMHISAHLSGMVNVGGFTFKSLQVLDTSWTIIRKFSISGTGLINGILECTRDKQLMCNSE